MTISLTLRRLAPCATVSFAVPLPPLDLIGVTLSIAGVPIPIRQVPLLWWHGPDGRPSSPKSVLLQFDAAYMPADVMEVTLDTSGGISLPGAVVPFAEVSHPVTHSVPVADYAIVKDANGVYSIPPTNIRDLPLFEAREPCAVAEFAPGYLASTGVFGHLLSQQEVAADPALAGVKYLSEAFGPCVKSALYLDEYPVLASAVTLPLPVEGFLYDRVATLMLALAHTDDEALRRPAYRYAWAYQAGIVLDGAVGGPGYGLRGYWNGKGSWDSKYSHARGLFLYYALTGDEGALAAIRAIGDLWAGDLYFSLPYQNGKIRGRDKLWTERLLGTAFEGCYYGFAATGEASYLAAFSRLLATAYRHITTQDQAELDAIVQPWVEAKADGTSVTHRFPPQNAWVHNSAQASEGSMTDPWCSGWMIELVLDSLVAYQTMTGDPRVDEIFARLGRFLRDTGISYRVQAGYSYDTFLAPVAPYTTPGSRKVIAMYGSGRKMDGSRVTSAEYSDLEHAPDTTGMTAAALRAVMRVPSLDEGPMGPFASEQACNLAMHHEMSWTAQEALRGYSRSWIYTDPRLPVGTYHAQGRIAMGTKGDPANFAAYVTKYGIGYPRIRIGPERKLSWWFNSSILQFGLLREQGVAIPVLQQGWVQPGVPPPPPPVNHVPLAEAGGPYDGVAGTEIVLPGVGSDPDGDPLTFGWAYGDGATGTDQVGRHTYTTPGVYVATLTVTDSKGLSATDTAQVTVLTPPPTYDELVARVATLDAENAQLQQDLAAQTATVATLTSANAALAAKVASAIAVLEA